MSFAFVFCGAVSAVNGTWHGQVIESTDDVGSGNSIEVDSDGNSHITYHDNTDGLLKHAVKKEGTWYIETVESGDVGDYSSLKLDSNGNPHIGYYCKQNKTLKYAVKNGNSWSCEPVDYIGEDISGQYISLALDSMNKPHIAYYDPDRWVLKYASKTDTGWTIETVDGILDDVDFDTGYDAVIDLDSSNQPHILYRDYYLGVLKHAYKSGGVWNKEIVDNVVTSGFATSIKIDNNDNIHITYASDPGYTIIKYAVLSGGIWKKEVVTQIMADRTSLDVDANGNPFMVFIGEGQLGYAYKTGSTWVKNILSEDASWEYNENNAQMSLDSAGNPHISFYDGANRDLKYYYMIQSPNSNCPGGNYYSPISVVLNSKTNFIYYTLDGSIPTNYSNKYTGPLTISTSKIIRFFVQTSAGDFSETITKNYKIYKLSPYSYKVKVKYRVSNKKYKVKYRVKYKKKYKYKGKWRYKWKYKWKYKWVYKYKYKYVTKWGKKWVLT